MRAFPQRYKSGVLTAAATIDPDKIGQPIGTLRRAREDEEAVHP